MKQFHCIFDKEYLKTNINKGRIIYKNYEINTMKYEYA